MGAIEDAKQREAISREVTLDVAEAHNYVVHGDGSECPDGCDAPGDETRALLYDQGGFRTRRADVIAGECNLRAARKALDAAVRQYDEARTAYAKAIGIDPERDRAADEAARLRMRSYDFAPLGVQAALRTAAEMIAAKIR